MSPNTRESMPSSHLVSLRRTKSTGTSVWRPVVNLLFASSNSCHLHLHRLAIASEQSIDVFGASKFSHVAGEDSRGDIPIILSVEHDIQPKCEVSSNTLMNVVLSPHIYMISLKARMSFPKQFYNVAQQEHP